MRWRMNSREPSGVWILQHGTQGYTRKVGKDRPQDQDVPPLRSGPPYHALQAICPMCKEFHAKTRGLYGHDEIEDVAWLVLHWLKLDPTTIPGWNRMRHPFARVGRRASRPPQIQTTRSAFMELGSAELASPRYGLAPSVSRLAVGGSSASFFRIATSSGSSQTPRSENSACQSDDSERQQGYRRGLGDHLRVDDRVALIEIWVDVALVKDQRVAGRVGRQRRVRRGRCNSRGTPPATAGDLLIE